ncbi:MAG: hypothetical protein LBR23_07260 [Spirochaetaceae bacterium]|jgi:hypothetical protein|nr:hypothetical protein [Spirochaetaceae bacterium]
MQRDDKDLHEEAAEMTRIITAQCGLLDIITGTQQKLRRSVLAKDWESLAADLPALETLSGQFAALEAERDALCRAILGQGSGGDFYLLLDRFPGEVRGDLLDLYTRFKRKLLESRRESRGLRTYLKIMLGFLQGVFDSAIPNRRNKVYSHTGAIVHAAPESLVLNTLL